MSVYRSTYAVLKGVANCDGAWRRLVKIFELGDPRPYNFQPSLYGKLIYTVIYLTDRLLTQENPNSRFPSPADLRRPAHHERTNIQVDDELQRERVHGHGGRRRRVCTGTQAHRYTMSKQSAPARSSDSFSCVASFARSLSEISWTASTSSCSVNSPFSRQGPTLLPGQSDNISHIDIEDDHIDTVISHIISPYSISISRMTIWIYCSQIEIPYPMSIFISICH